MPTLQGAATLAGAGGVVAQTRQKWSAGVGATLAGAGSFTNLRTGAPSHASGVFKGSGSLWTPILPIRLSPRQAQAPAPRPYSASIYDDPHQTIPNSFVAITKSDTIPLPPRTVRLWIGGTGDLAVKGETDAVATTITAVPAGTLFDGRFSYVMSTNTTATNIVAFVVK